MKINIKQTVLLIIIFSSFFYNNITAQTEDCDSVKIQLNDAYGSIQWQESIDGINFTPIQGAVSNSIKVLSQQDKYYRAKIEDGTCLPYYSDTIFKPKSYSLTQAEINLIMNGNNNDMFTVMNIFEQPDSIVLRNQSLELSIDCNYNEIVHMKDRMYETVNNPNNAGVGLAAPQIGINRKACWLQRYDKAPWWNPFEAPFEFYINPEILAYSDTLKRRGDGCLSVPQQASYPDVVDSSYRAIWVQVRYQLLDGTIITEIIDDEYTAHIFQHEIDHLNGVMFMDRDVEENPDKYTILKFIPPKGYKTPRM